MARELSPFSQRRLLTQQLARGEVPTPPRVVAERASSKDAPRASKEPERASREPEKEKAGRGSEKASREPDNGGGAPSVSSRRRSRSRSRERRQRDRSRDRRRDRSRDRHRDRSRDRRRDGSRDGKRRDQSVERQRDRRANGDRTRDSRADGDRRRERNGSRDRHSRRDRSRSRDRRRSHRDRDRDRSRDDKRARSPLAIRERKHRTRSPSASRSPPPKRRRRSRSRSRSRSPRPRNTKPLPDQEVSFRGVDNSDQAPTKYGGAPVNKEKPNFRATGALAKHANRVEGTKISLKYHEPAEARKPPSSQPWRLFVFKGDDVIDTIELWQKSCWLLGRSHEVVDYVLEHPSSSGQHAVIQFRYIQKVVEDEFGVKSTKGRVKPYIIDLESSNGTELNGKDIEASHYCELRDKDILRFAGSEREYVVMLPPPEEKKE